MNTYEQELKGLVDLGPMQHSMLFFARGIRVLIQEELEKPRPNNHLISILHDAARLGWEYSHIMEGSKSLK
jgi:hypothetical protein